MRRSRILATTALVLAWSAVRAPSSRAGTSPRLWRDQSGQVWAESGPGGPASADPAAVVASRALAGQPAALGGVDPAELRLVRDARLGPDRGHLLVYDRTRDGLPVIGGRVVVRVDPAGRVRWIASESPSRPATWSGPPVWDADRAIGRAAAVLGAAGPSSGDRRTRAVLLWWSPPGATPRLAWRVDLPTDLVRMRAPRALVDARDGRVLATDDRLFTATPRADVFEVSPAVTPELTRVTLSTLADGAPALTSSDLIVTGCPDTGACRDVLPNTLYHACDPIALAAPDAGGDFVYPFVSDEALDDELAEVMAFYQVQKGLDVARALGGLDDLAEVPLPVVANFKSFDTNSFADCQDGTYDGESDLGPFDSAFFSREGEGLGGDYHFAVVLGQGRTIDYALDGDVVQHELGHAVTATLAPDLVRSYIDRYGTNLTPAGLHEGFSDLLNVMVTGDPKMGEYAGRAVADGKPVRDLTRRAACPADVVGEEHTDSLPLTSAFWRAREALDAANPGAATSFDQAVFTAWSALGAFADYQRAADLTAMELEVLLGAGPASAAREIFAEHGLDGCGGRAVDGATGKVFSSLPGLPDPERGGTVPGPFQLRYQLDAPAAALAVDVSVFDSFGIDPSQREAVAQLKPGDEPILWSEDTPGEPTSDATIEVPMTVDDQRHGRAVFDGPFAPGVYHLMVVNRGARADLHDTVVISAPAQPEPGDGGGCGCGAADPGHGSLAGLILCAVCAVVLSRVRPRRRDRSGARG